jgi:RNA recognition motif-containing protein
VLTTIFVGNLPATATENGLREVFEKFGSVNSIRLVARRRLAYVELDRDGAHAAVDALRGTQIDGRTVDVVLDESSGGRAGRRGSRGRR